MQGSHNSNVGNQAAEAAGSTGKPAEAAAAAARPDTGSPEPTTPPPGSNPEVAVSAGRSWVSLRRPRSWRNYLKYVSLLLPPSAICFAGCWFASNVDQVLVLLSDAVSATGLVDENLDSFQVYVAMYTAKAGVAVTFGGGVLFLASILLLTALYFLPWAKEFMNFLWSQRRRRPKRRRTNSSRES